MITRDPYGISGAVAPWRSLDAMEPIAERRITEQGYRGGRTLWAVPAAGLQPEKSWLPPTYQGEKAKTVP